jgi:hypothetical protein
MRHCRMAKSPHRVTHGGTLLLLQSTIVSVHTLDDAGGLSPLARIGCEAQVGNCKVRQVRRSLIERVSPYT